MIEAKFKSDVGHTMSQQPANNKKKTIQVQEEQDSSLKPKKDADEKNQFTQQQVHQAEKNLFQHYFMSKKKFQLQDAAFSTP